ncbi:hypothetical protein DE146DRAFT_710315 [Phaeosphaeria sp. MPI-PUGE-AT-0046c]|nr:hypothetical protein DE146DRAFT_710315 [Phaeosphaeria sp. MPI-PUGE-AT-0046c]
MMYKRPTISRKVRTCINDLPEELTLYTCAYFTHIGRNSDLVRLALVSRKWRKLAQEWLIKVPRFNLTHIDKYLWELSHHEHLHPQIQSLEIWSKSENRLPRDGEGRVIREYRPTSAPITWNILFALWEDCIPALFGVLICVLPNLKPLRLGDTWLIDFPIFCSMLAGEASSYMFPIRRPVTDPREIFPATLEVLRISEATAETPPFLQQACVAKTGGHFPRLQRLELYFIESLDETSWIGNPVPSLQRMCRQAEVSVYMYLPVQEMKTWVIGCAPWRLREDRQAFELAKLKDLD